MDAARRDLTAARFFLALFPRPRLCRCNIYRNDLPKREKQKKNVFSPENMKTALSGQHSFSEVLSSTAEAAIVAGRLPSLPGTGLT
jgi:hypothetical protein